MTPLSFLAICSKCRTWPVLFCVMAAAGHGATLGRAAEADPPAVKILNVWPARPPGDTSQLGAEYDTTGPDGRNVAGQRVIRLTNVSTPTLEIYAPAPDLRTGTAVVICPGGGHRILAYDLEGTEVATWLQSIGVTGIVLKYRVPDRNPQQPGAAALQDAQRAISLVRHHAEDWQLDPARIGILGFSAGGQTAALCCLNTSRRYEAIDEIDGQDHRPSFGVLVYPAYLANQEKTDLIPEAQVTSDMPPMFLVHAFDDPIPVENSLLLYLAMKRANSPAELHAFGSGGHGFGMRATEEPCSRWPEACQAWLRRNGWLKTLAR